MKKELVDGKVGGRKICNRLEVTRICEICCLGLDEEGMRQIIIQEELLNLITITLREKMIGLSLKSQ